MIIDFHTHCFPDKLAGRAIDTLKNAAAIESYTDGTLASLKAIEKASGVDKFVVNNIATNSKQQKNVNDFAASINSNDVISFGSVFPFAEDALSEVDRIVDMGLKGIKLHPEYQGFFVDDERLIPLYDKIASRGLILTFHAGEDLGFMHPYHATPERFANVVDRIKTDVVIAHWGSAGMFEDVLKYLCGKNVYFDLSFGYGVIPLAVAKEIVENHGADKLLFGTDLPWHTPEMEMYLIERLGLSDSDKRKIYSENACKLLNI